MNPKFPFPEHTQVGDASDMGETGAMTTQMAAQQTTLSNDTPRPGSFLGNGQMTQVACNAGTTSAGFPLVDSGRSATFGRYELVSEIARGGMGVVYRARQQGLDRIVALKMVIGGPSESLLHQRLLQEARSAGSLDHPNIVPIYDSGEIDDRLFFTMAFVDGPDLKKYCEARGTLTTTEVIRLFSQIVDGLAHAHSKGIIHRDLKPANILIDRDGRPRVTDFGLAKRTDGDTEMTKTGQVMGTPAYMAPEQARGRKDVGPAADVYALGGILYYLLTQQAPFTGETTTEILFKLATEEPTPPRHLNPQTPVDLEAICLKCLAKTPESRFADAVALSAEFSQLAVKYLPQSASYISGVVSLPRTRAPSSAALESTNVSLASQETVPGKSAVVPAPVAEVKPAGRGLWYLAGGSALLAAGVVGALLMRGGKPSANDAVFPQNPAVEVHATVAVPETPSVPAWKVNVSGDIAMTFEFLAPGVQKERGVVIQNQAPLAFRVQAERDCYVAIWSVDPQGNVVKLFPNRFDGDSRLVANQIRNLPGKVGYDMTASPTTGDGFETLRFLASTQPFRELTGDEVVQGFDLFVTEEGRKKLNEWTRGIELSARKSNHQVARGELMYRVSP